MEDQGIMALPQAGMQAPTAQPQAAIDPKNFSPQVFDYARMQPEQFGQDIMSGIEAADPAMAAEFKQALAGLQLPPEVIDALGDMVDAILNDPENYDEIRAQFIATGIPEEIIPPTFDAAYFAALNIALDQLSAQQTPVGMARGGIMTLGPVATELAKMGRGGDRMIAHITPSEARMLRRSGGAGTINPYTGRPEFIKNTLKKVGKSIVGGVKSAVKSVGRVVKKVAASPIGKLALTAAAIYFMGGAGLNLASGSLGITNAALAQGVNAFAGSTLVNLASGQKLGDAIKGGVMTGVLAGVTTGVAKGFDATVPGAPVAPGPNVEVNALGETTGTTVQRVAPISDATQTVADVSATSNVMTPNAVSANVLTPDMVTAGPDLTAGQTAFTYEPNFRLEGPGVDLAQNAANTASDVTSGIGNVPNDTFIPGTLSVSGTPYASEAYGAIPPGTFPEAVQLPAPAPWQNSFAQPTSTPGVMDQLSSGDYTGAAKTAYQNTVDFFNPNSGMPGPTAVEDRALALQQKFPSLSSEAALKQAAADVAQNTPGMISRYAPITGAALGAAYLGGAFTPEEPQAPGTLPKETGFDLIAREPEVYGTTPGGAQTTYADMGGANIYYNQVPGYGQNYSQYQFNPVQMAQLQYPNLMYTPNTRQFAQGGIAALAPSRYAMGGYARGGVGSMENRYPRRTGQISGPGTGTSDSIPAMLSDGEFVMTAKAVRGAGGGSRREGARKMYQMMRKFERNS